MSADPDQTNEIPERALDRNQQGNAQACMHCGSQAIVVHVSLGQRDNCEPIGPKYNKSSWLGGIGTEEMCGDLCRDCGTLTRIYVENTGREWIQE